MAAGTETRNKRLSGFGWAFRLGAVAQPRREHGGPEGRPRPTLPMTCSGVFRRVMFVAHYVHGVRSWRAFFILEELPSICAAREQGDRRVGVGVRSPCDCLSPERA